MDILQVENTSGWQIFDGKGYRYGPSIIINSDNSIDMWLAAHGSKGAWDCIKYRRSTDGGRTWTADVDALTPTAGSRDAYSCCDPGVIKFGGFYYIGYTSTESSSGTNNQVYIARSSRQAGPYQKWDGVGWSGNPQPILAYTGDPGRFGFGEPSFVLRGGTLYVYFTNIDGETHTDLAVCSDPTVANWPANLVMKGHVINRQAEDSTDIKYVDAMERFIAVSTHNRWTSNSTVDLWQSNDGLLWQRAPFRGATVQCGAHNIGISGSETGHIDIAKRNFIAYAYQPVGSSRWGKWPTYMDFITLSKAGFGKAVNAEVSSIPAGIVWNWNGPRLADGNTDSCWSSDNHKTTSTSTEWAYVDLGANFRVYGVRVTPRSGGMCFPVDFKWQYSTDASAWSDVSGQSYTNYPRPDGSDMTFTFESEVSARYVRLYATKLSADNYGNNYLQIAEIAPMVSSPSLPRSFSLRSPANGATGVAVTPALSWTTTDATSYSLMIADNSSFNNPVVTRDCIGNTSYILSSTRYATASTLRSNTLYYWQVVAYNGAGFTASDIQSFTTATTTLVDMGCVGGWASSQLNADWAPVEAWDGNTDTSWSSLGHTGADYAEWIHANTGAVNSIGGVKLTPGGCGYGFPIDFKIQYSTNARSWNDVPGQSYTGYANPHCSVQTFAFSTPVTAQYLRFYATKLGQDENGVYLFQLAEITPLLSINGNPAACSRIAATASSKASDDWVPMNAIDGDNINCWSSTVHRNASATEWIRITLDKNYLITRLRIFPRTIEGTSYCFPSAFSFRFSTNDSDWNPVPGQSHTSYQNPGATEQVFVFAQPVTARYIKVVATALGADQYNNYYCQFAEVNVDY